jgi:signal peptidase I
MEPTLHCARPAAYCEAAIADRVLARSYRANQRPRRGEILVFETPKRNGVDLAQQACGAGGTFVKRLIGLPGETIHENRRGFISVNGKRLSEPYVQSWRRGRDLENRNRTWHVPKGAYFLMGDNRWQSCDSRRWGAVVRSAIVGRVIAVYWPSRRVRRE